MSLLAVVSAPKQIVISADSRGVFEGSIASNEYQKLFQAGSRTVCGMTGFCNLPGPKHVYISDLVASSCGRDELLDNPLALLNAICDAVELNLSNNIITERLPATDAILFGVFAIQKRADGAVTFFEAEFPLINDSSGKRCLGQTVIKRHADGDRPPHFFYSLGHGDCISEAMRYRVDPEVMRDEEICSAVEVIFDAAAASPLNNGEIGGPIDIAVIDGRGVRWLRKKNGPVNKPLPVPEHTNIIQAARVAVVCVAAGIAFAFGGVVLGLCSLVSFAFFLTSPCKKKPRIAPGPSSESSQSIRRNLPEKGVA